MRLLPNDLLDVPKNVEFSVDTETSGLHPDSGARVSTVSVAFLESEVDRWFSVPLEPGIEEWPSGIVEVGGWFRTPGGPQARFISAAWPFDQGVDNTGKSEDTGLVGLWDDTVNLDSSDWSDLMSVLTGRPLVMHNAKFDCMMVKAGVRWMPNLGIDLHQGATWDTMAGCSLLFPQFNNALKGPGSWTYANWGAESAEEQKTIKTYLQRQKLPSGRWDLMPWSVIAKYAMGDATLTLRLKHEQARLLSDPKQVALFQRRMDVMRMLYRVEQRGLPYDALGSRQTAEVLKARIEEQKRKLPFEPATLPAGKAYWFGPDGLNLTPYETTPKGAPAVNDTVLTRMIEDKIPGAAAWGEVQKGQTADSRWYSGYPDMCGEDGRLRGSLRQFGTVSHRFSIERAQLQAIPQDYRLNKAILKGLPSPRQFIRSGAPEGMILWDLDLANAELRIATLYAKADSMMKLIKTGADVHGVTATELFGTTPDDPTWERDRMVAKRGNFSLIFDVGWETFQEMVYKQADIRLSEKESRRIVREWKALYPEFKRAVDLHSRKVEDRRRRSKSGLGWVAVWNGERRWYGKSRDPKEKGKDEDTHSAFNQRVQTALGQFAIEWWLAIEREGELRFKSHKQCCPEECGGTSYDPCGWEGVSGLGLVMMVHDSADILVPQGRDGEAFVEWCQAEGVRLWERTFPGVPGGVDAKPYGT